MSRAVAREGYSSAQKLEQLRLYLLAWYLSGKQYLIRLDLEEGVRVFFVFAR